MADRMPYRQRRDWLCARIAEEHRAGVDVLNADFVTDYAEHTRTRAVVQFFGAPKCPQLGSDFGRMHLEGLLKRGTIGIGDGLSGQGFPKWVYTYRLTSFGRHVAERAQAEFALAASSEDETDPSVTLATITPPRDLRTQLHPAPCPRGLHG